MFTQPLAAKIKEVRNQALLDALRKTLCEYLTDAASRCSQQQGINVSEFPSTTVAADVLRDLSAFPDVAAHQRMLGLRAWGRHTRIAVVTDAHIDTQFAKVVAGLKTSPTARWLAMDIMSREEFALFVLNDLLDEAERADIGWTSF